MSVATGPASPLPDQRDRRRTSRFGTARTRLIASLALSVLSFAFTFAAAEIGARYYLVHLAPRYIFDKYASLDQLEARYGEARHTEHRYLMFYPKPDWISGLNRHNSLGYRGEEVAVPKPQGVFRIVCMGGSTTYSASVEDYREAYPYRLQAELREAGYENVEVVNAGVFSYTTIETLVNFETRVLDLDPDLVIIYDGVNDIDSRLILPKRYYTGDGIGYAQRLPVSAPTVWERSTLIRMALVYTGRAEPSISLLKNFVYTPESYVGNLFQNQVKNGTYPAAPFRASPVMEILAANAPVFFERNLRTLVAIADLAEVQVVLATFTASPLFDDNPRASSPEFQAAYTEQNDVLRRIAASTSAELFDFAAVMPLDAVFFSDGVHYTAEGNALRGELFARFLIENGLVGGEAGR